MLKVLVMTDNPSFHTGMARVGREIACYLATHEFKVIYVAWGFSTGTENLPFKIYQSQQQDYGKAVLENTVLKERPDIVLTIGDPWMIKYMADPMFKVRRLFQWVGYTAVDGLTINNTLPSFWENIVEQMDYVVSYTDYGTQALENTFHKLKNKVTKIHHGVCHKTFYALKKEEIKEKKVKFGLDPNMFIYLFVGRNQPRKNIPEILKIWKEVSKKEKDAILFLHCNFKDSAGLDMDELLLTFGLDQPESRIAFIPDIAYGENSNNLLDTKTLNSLYNVADCFINLSSEGFGLPIIESMACGTPCILLDHSAGGELGSMHRSIKVKVEASVVGRFMTERPFPSIEDGVEKFIEMKKLIQSNDKKIQLMIYDAWRFAIENTWHEIGKQWKVYLDKIENPLSYPIIMEEV